MGPVDSTGLVGPVGPDGPTISVPGVGPVTGVSLANADPLRAALRLIRPRLAIVKVVATRGSLIQSKGLNLEWCPLPAAGGGVCCFKFSWCTMSVSLTFNCCFIIAQILTKSNSMFIRVEVDYLFVG